MSETIVEKFERAAGVVAWLLDKFETDTAAYEGDPDMAPPFGWSDRVVTVTSQQLAGSRELVRLAEQVSREGRKVRFRVEVEAPDDTLGSYGFSAPLRDLCLAQREETTR